MDPCVLISKEYTPNFRKWLSEADRRLDIVNMYLVRADSIEYYLERSDGIIISGGPDVNPSLYGKEDEIDKCEDIDYGRDTLEMRMIRYAMTSRVPLLGICRGHQILNVANGGTLIVDIPTDYDTVILHRGGTSKHWVDIIKGTFLNEICQKEGGIVNSYHHQGVEKVASLFRAVAYAPDSLVEAIELADRSYHPFILGVQWHPEAMEYTDSLSGPIAESFISEAKMHFFERRSVKETKKARP
jgi:putative glutamine amidotransferase